jgi:hypothetical protein
MVSERMISVSAKKDMEKTRERKKNLRGVLNPIAQAMKGCSQLVNK